MKSAFELTFRQSKLGAKGAFTASWVGLICSEEEVSAVGAPLMVGLLILDGGVTPSKARAASFCSFTSLVSFGGCDTAEVPGVAKGVVVEGVDGLEAVSRAVETPLVVGDVDHIGCEACTAIAGALVWVFSAGMAAGAGAGIVGDTISSLKPRPNFSSGVVS